MLVHLEWHPLLRVPPHRPLSTGITGLNHKLEDYYHTRRDTYDNMNLQGLADCYAVSMKVLEMFDEGAKQ